MHTRPGEQSPAEASTLPTWVWQRFRTALSLADEAEATANSEGSEPEVGGGRRWVTRLLNRLDATGMCLPTARPGAIPRTEDGVTSGGRQTQALLSSALWLCNLWRVLNFSLDFLM